MGDIPDDVPALDEIADDDPLPDYWDENTTITVRRWVKESLDRHREGRPWGEYLEMLRQEHADPITFNDVERMAEVLAEELDSAETDTDEIAREVSRQLDYAMLASKVADEVEGRLR